MPQAPHGEGLYVRRAVRLLAIGIFLEAALFAVAKLSPALSSIVTSAYMVVAVLVAVAIWRTRHRRGEDRRVTERRGSGDPPPTLPRNPA